MCVCMYVMALTWKGVCFSPALKHSSYSTYTLNPAISPLSLGLGCFSSSSISSRVLSMSCWSWVRISRTYPRLPTVFISDNIHSFFSILKSFPLESQNSTPRTFSAAGELFRKWISGSENFPSERSSQNPFFAVYYKIRKEVMVTSFIPCHWLFWFTLWTYFIWY